MVSALRNLLVSKWLERKERALRIPTFLEKVAFAVYLEISAEEGKDYRQVKDTSLKLFSLLKQRFRALHNLENLKMLPGESHQEFLQAINQLLGNDCT